LTYPSVEEERVHAPWEGPGTLVEVVVGRRLRNDTVVLSCKMSLVFRVRLLKLVDVGSADSDWEKIRSKRERER
jgi:hypothetical protein